MIDFAENNPSVAIYVNEKKGEHPIIEAKYCMLSLLYSNTFPTLINTLLGTFEPFEHMYWYT